MTTCRRCGLVASIFLALSFSGAIAQSGGPSSPNPAPEPPTSPLTPEQQTIFDQNTNNDPLRVLGQQPALQENDELSSLPSSRGAPGDQAPLSPEVAALTLNLKGVVLEGNTRFDVAEFVGLWDSLIGQNVTIGDLSGIASEIQTFYRNEGYVFTRALLLQDGLRQGTAQIRVVEGVLGRVTVEESGEPVGPVLALMQRMAAQLEGLESPHISALERVLLVMNDVPGITRATAVPRSGQDGEVGTVDIVINVERTPIAGIVFADNRQAPSAGQGLVGASAEYGSFSSAGDTTRITILNSFWNTLDDLSERRVYQVEHSRYILPSGLEIAFNGLYSKTDLGDTLGDIGIEGRQYELGVGLKYPVIRTRPISINAFGSFNFIDIENELVGGALILTDESLRILTIGVDALFRDATGFTAAEIGYRRGFEFLGGENPVPSRAGSDLSTNVVYASVERDQFIHGGFTSYFRAAGQWSPDSLVASQEFQIGGTNFGRGFDPSEFSGDKGFGVNFEMRYTQPLDEFDFIPVSNLEGASLQFYGFVDHGQVFNPDDPFIGSNRVTSAGGGLRFDLPQDIYIEIEVAQPFSKLERTKNDSPRAFFFVQKRF